MRQFINATRIDDCAEVCISVGHIKCIHSNKIANKGIGSYVRSVEIEMSDASIESYTVSVTELNELGMKW